MRTILWAAAGILLTLTAHAKCFHGDALMIKKNYAKAEEFYLLCANNNDADAQYALGVLYLEGTLGVPNKEKALLFFRLGAENGNAASMRELAKLMVALDKGGPDTRMVLARYQQTLRDLNLKASTGAFDTNETNMLPYAWLLLAAERGDNKWFYSRDLSSDPEAVRLMKTMESSFTPAMREQAMRQASVWKEGKLNAVAKIVLSPDEYQEFRRIVYPKSGPVDPSVRMAEVMKLKKRVEAYVGRPAL